jgi:hypothetical protein
VVLEQPDRPERRTIVREALSFLALAVGLLSILFVEAIRYGHVMSASGLLFALYPWRAYVAQPGEIASNPILSDIPAAMYPFAIHAARTVRDGALPLWSASMYAGQPFLGSYLSAVFSPFTSIGYIFPVPYSTVAIASSVLLVGGVGTFVFVRRLGLGWAASAFAGVAYLLNPFSVYWLRHPLAPTAAWLPWLLWATERLVSDVSRRTIAFLAMIVAVLLLSGHPETAFKSLLLAGGYGLLRALQTRQAMRSLVALACAVGVGLLLAAMQIVPFLEYLTESRAVAVREALSRNALFAPIATIITAVVPRALGTPLDANYAVTANRFGYEANIFDHIVYPGMAVWLLAAVGLTQAWKDWRVRFFVAAGVVAGLVMYGTPGIVDVVSHLPLLRVTNLARFGLVVITAAVVLAAFGVAGLTRHDQQVPGGANADSLWRPAVIAAAIAFGSILMFLVLGRRILIQTGGRSVYAWHASIAVVISMFGVALIVARARRAIPVRVFVPAVLGLLVVDLLIVGRGFHPMLPAKYVFPELPEIEYVKSDSELFRVGGWETTLLPNTALVYGLQDFRGYDSLVPVRYGELIDAGFTFATYLNANSLSTGQLDNARLLDLLNVKYIFAEPRHVMDPGQYTRVHVGAAPLYRNDDYYPRAFLVGSYRAVPDSTAARFVAHGDVDLRTTAILPADLPVELRPDAQGMPNDNVVVRTYSDTVVEIETMATGRRLLVLTDLHYPGWHATVDGEPVEIHRANYAFRGVPIAAGRHVVRFEYRPVSVFVGLATSAMTLVALVGFVFIRPRSADTRRPGG